MTVIVFKCFGDSHIVVLIVQKDGESFIYFICYGRRTASHILFELQSYLKAAV